MDQNVKELFLKNHQFYWFKQDAYRALQSGETKTAYTMGKDGKVYRMGVNHNGGIQIFQCTAIERLHNMDDIHMDLQLKLEKKIPMAIYGELIGAFYSLYKKIGDEVAALVFQMSDDPAINEKYKEHMDFICEDFFVYYPRQRVSKAMVDYTRDEVHQALYQNFHMIISAHSHNSMGAFFSAVDDTNDFLPTIYMVVGGMGSGAKIDQKYRLKIGKDQKPLTPEMIFDATAEEIESLSYKDFAVNYEDHIVKSRITVPQFQNYVYKGAGIFRSITGSITGNSKKGNHGAPVACDYSTEADYIEPVQIYTPAQQYDWYRGRTVSIQRDRKVATYNQKLVDLYPDLYILIKEGEEVQ